MGFFSNLFGKKQKEPEQEGSETTVEETSQNEMTDKQPPSEIERVAGEVMEERQPSGESEQAS